MAVSAPPLPLSQTSIECLDGQTPVAVRTIDLEQCPGELQLPLSSGGHAYRQLLVLVRQDGYPLGWCSFPVSPDGTVPLDDLGFVTDLPQVAVPDGDVGTSLVWGRPPTEPSTPGAVGQSLVSVVIATCADAKTAVRCVEAIQSAASGPYEVIVVENRPAHSTVKRALDEHFGDDRRVRYVEERRPGLACARNAGLRVAQGELVAFTDDDVIVDSAWLPAIRATFAASQDVDCMTGLILPLELETQAQLLVERFAGYAKGFLPRIYALEQPPADQPLFPYTAGYFGSGANMAFRTAALRRLGSFDPVLGTGTRSRGCEDLDICIRVLNAGSRLAYEPRAVVWHRHPDTHAHLRRRAFDYGAALGAMLTKHLLVGPNRWGMVSRIPQAARYYTDPRSRKNATRGNAFPPSLTRLERTGLLYGPLAYLASRLEALR
ncbi:MAG TPA: glycosyltransferase [Solirubrobacteraceae bacterium]|jgi:GT2 family glycosyltransferase|nr:glycosyltransferase [Solirubrobacteraceae bacterium]